MLHLDDRELDEIIEQIQEHALLADLRIVDAQGSVVQGRGGVVALEGRIQIEGKNVTVQIGLDENFPLSLPLVILTPGDSLGFIPHVDKDGYVCYGQKEGLLLDRHNPAKIVEEAIEQSILLLTRGLRGENKLDFVEEFDAYWRRLDGALTVLSFVEPVHAVRRIVAARRGGSKEELYALLGSSIDAAQSHSGSKALATHTHRNALYVPFREGTYIEPPHYGTFWTVEEIQEMVRANLSPVDYRRLRRLARKWKQEEVVVFKLSRPSGGVALFGINFSGVENCHPLLQGGSAHHMTPLVLDRRDKEYLLPRGGANSQLREKQVALIGCGSVGGFLALELTRAGVLNLTLVDQDAISPDNTFRHVLGKDAWLQPKAEGIKNEIERKYPYVEIEAIADRAERSLAMGALKPRDYDLVIIATGDDTVNLHLNEVLRTHRRAPPTLFAWLEPYGIGGHALLTGNSDESGCLECLFTPVPGDDESTIHSRAAFAASGQLFTKDLLGCSNPFTPYGSADALQTALLASRLAVDALIGEVAGNPLLSWKGSSRDFLHAGFRLSSRYSLTEEELFEKRYDYKNPSCPVCGLPD